MPRQEQERREKAGKVSSGGAWKRKTGLDAPPEAGKKRKSGKSESGRGMGEKNRLGCPAGSRKEEKKQERREKAGKVRPSGAWERKTGLDALP